MPVDEVAQESAKDMIEARKKLEAENAEYKQRIAKVQFLSVFLHSRSAQ
jgi:hypothetical protein